MKLVGQSVLSLACAACIVHVLEAFITERFEPVFYWALPLFHKIYPAWTAGPNPKAMGCALWLNTILIATLTFLLLSLWKRRGQT